MPSLKRGISIHTAMNWAELEENSRRYKFPAFADEHYRLTAAELIQLHEAGFDFVRLTVDPGPFLQFTAERRDELDHILTERVRLILEAGLSVIVDFHPNTQNATYLPEYFIKSTKDPFTQAFGTVLTRTAALLSSSFGNERVALELLNEPWTSGMMAAARWQTTVEFYHQAARHGSPLLPLVISGGDAGSARGLAALDPRPFANSRVIYSFHCYTPLAFTHQGEGGAKMAFLKEVPYPLGERPSEQTIDAIRSGIDHTARTKSERQADFAAARNYLDWTYHKGVEANLPRHEFEVVARWATDYNISNTAVLLGEFGVTRNVRAYPGAPEEDRLRWLRDVRSLSEEFGYAWAYWVYRGYSGFMLVEKPGSDQLDTGSLQALGLKSR